MFLDCKPGVTHTTILSMLGVFFTNFSFSSYVFFTLIFFLEDPATFNMSPERALSQAAWLLFLSYPFNLISSILSGYLFVRFGRRKVILAGFIFGITGTILIPFVSRQIYPSVFSLACCIMIATALTQNPPLIADYVKPNSIGKAYAMQGLLTLSGTIFAVAVLFGTTKDLSFEKAALIVCPILYLMSFISVCGLKEVKSATEHLNHSEDHQAEERDSFCRSFSLQLRLLMRFSLADSVYNLSYCGLYVSEMGYLLSFVFINAWTSQFFVDHPDGLSKAMDLSAMITTTSMVIGLFMGLLLGHIIDRCAIIHVFLLCYLTRAVGLLIMTCVITNYEE